MYFVRDSDFRDVKLKGRSVSSRSTRKQEL